MDVYAALADPVRRDLLRRLARGPARVIDLSADHPISRPAISRHLRVLSEAGLVSAEERGRERHYEFHPDGLRPLAGLLRELRGPLPAEAFDGLEMEVRRTGRERRTADTPDANQEETA